MATPRQTAGNALEPRRRDRKFEFRESRNLNQYLDNDVAHGYEALKTRITIGDMEAGADFDRGFNRCRRDLRPGTYGGIAEEAGYRDAIEVRNRQFEPWLNRGIGTAKEAIFVVFACVGAMSGLTVD